MRWTCPSDRLPEARAKLEAAFAPAPEDDLAKALYMLRKMTRGRDGETRDLDSSAVEITAWVVQLKAYPADVAVSCLQDWPKHSPWWPTWFELRERLERGVSQRRVMLHVLGQLERESPPETKRLNALPETDERRAQVVEDALRKLAEATSMGPFKAERKLGETVAGRANAGTDALERNKAEATLEQMANEQPRFTLSALALNAIGITPPEPEEPDEENPWHTEEPS